MTRSDAPLDPTVMVRAALDVLVFAPLGLGARLVEDAPGAVVNARRELSNARFIGRLAVDQGIKQVRAHFDASSEPVSPVSPVTPERVAADPAEVAGPSDLSAHDLALPDYDTLPAIDIVGKLETLDVVDREAIERYESANRQRRTVLGKLAQLADR